MGLIEYVRPWFQTRNKATPELRQSPENPSTSLSNPAAWLVDFIDGGQTATGKRVTETTALQSSAVFACVRVISETIASLPLIVYERMEPRGKRRAVEHPLYSVLHDIPNPEMSSMTFRETITGHIATWGNGYAEIEVDAARNVLALWPLLPDRTEPIRRNGKKMYRTRIDSQEVILPADRVLHIPGFGFDGVKGYSIVGLARQGIGLSMAAEEFGARFFGNGATPQGVLMHDRTLSDIAKQNIKQSWSEQQGGLSNAQRVAVLEEGMRYEKIGIPPEDAQFLETRKFQVVDIARWFRMQPHKIQSMDAATFSNIEQQAIEFLTDVVTPWAKRWEDAIKTQLFSRADRERFFAEHLIDGILRGDSVSRAQYYNSQFNIGGMSINDIREKENMNPIEGGDRYFVPMNMIPLDMVDQQRYVDNTGSPIGARSVPERRDERREVEQRSLRQRQRIRKAYERIFKDAASRIVRREVNAVKKAVRRNLNTRDQADFVKWLQEFYEEHPAFIREVMTPVLRGFAESIQAAVAEEVNLEADITPEIERFVGEYVASLALRETNSSRGQIEALLRNSEPDEVANAIEERMDEWDERRPSKIAENETVRAGAAISKVVYIGAGITVLRWVASPDACPICKDMDGRTAGVQESFLSPSDEVAPGGDTTPLRPSTSISHPPLHRGCTCDISPA